MDGSIIDMLTFKRTKYKQSASIFSAPCFSLLFSLVTSAGALCPEDCKCVNLSIMLSPIHPPLLHTTKDTHGG